MGGLGLVRAIGVGGICAVMAGAAGCGDDQATSIASSQSGGLPGANRGPEAGQGAPVRPLSPLSGSMSGSRQPILKWTPPTRATVEVCADRGCGHVLESIEANHGEARPVAPLPAGPVFWRVVTNRSPSAAWELIIPARDTGTSIAWGVTPDYNADGRADIAIAAGNGNDTVSLFYGAAGGPPFERDLVLAAGPGYGRAIAAVGDVNGDGFGDLAIATGGDPGTVWINYGATSGFEVKLPLYPGAVTRFGTSIASAGDVNGDGYGDVIVGGTEAAQIFFGAAEGVMVEAAISLTGSTAAGSGGEATVVLGPADVNADGHPDVFVGGALYLGNGAGFTAQAGFAHSTFGTFVGDHNGDGFVDFGDYGVTPGTPAGIDPLDSLFVQAGEYVFGFAGDFDGDGFGDVVSNVSDLVGASERERLYFGAPGSCGSTGCRRFLPISIAGRSSSGAAATAFITSPGDVDGDGASELLVTIPSEGVARLFLGGSDRPLSFPDRTWTGPIGFGSSISSLFGTARPAL